MTVKQAIEALQKCPPDAVIVDIIDSSCYCELSVLGAQPQQVEMEVHRRDASVCQMPGAMVVVLD